MLTVGISLIKLGISLLSIVLSLMLIGFFFHATFFHLAIITVLIFVEPFFKIIFSFLLHEPQPIFVNESLDFAGSLCVIRYSSVSFCAIELFKRIPFLFLYLHQFFLINLLLVDMLLVILRTTLNGNLMLCEGRGRELQGLPGPSIIKMMARNERLSFGEGVERNCVLFAPDIASRHILNRNILTTCLFVLSFLFTNLPRGFGMCSLVVSHS